MPAGPSCCRSSSGWRPVDRLIDRVVYLLYGLTEEEVAIVEGVR